MSKEQKQFCRNNCPRSLGWNDAKRAECREQTACNEFREKFLDKPATPPLTDRERIFWHAVSRLIKAGEIPPVPIGQEKVYWRKHDTLIADKPPVTQEETADGSHARP